MIELSSLPVGIPNSELAFCTDAAPARIAKNDEKLFIELKFYHFLIKLPSKAFSRSSADHDVGAALNGAAKRIPSRRAIL